MTAWFTQRFLFYIMRAVHVDNTTKYSIILLVQIIIKDGIEVDLSKKPDSVGVFLGLITKEGRVRYQMRIEDDSSVTGISYKGDFELPGGLAKEKDLSKLLTPKGLIAEGIREVKEELGIIVSLPLLANPPLYWASYENPKNGKVDWAFMIPILPLYWDETVEVKRKIVDLNPRQLEVLGDLNLIVTGKKRMYRMGQGAIFSCSSNFSWNREAADLLTSVNLFWRRTEYFETSKWILEQFRITLRLEQS